MSQGREEGRYYSLQYFLTTSCAVEYEVGTSALSVSTVYSPCAGIKGCEGVHAGVCVRVCQFHY